MKLVYSGLFEHDGHFVSFKINEDKVEIKDTIFSKSKWHTREKIMEINDAISYQQDLIKFGYKHNLDTGNITIRLK